MTAQVQQFREILFWPFRFTGEDNASREFEKFTESSDSIWTKQADWLTRPYREGAVRPKEAVYGEFVYFHPFVQRFLYERESDGKAQAMQVWRRDDVSGVSVLLKDDPIPVQMTVEQLWLFHFKLGEGHGIWMMSIEVSAIEALSLNVVENFLDQFRRAYPPYWEQGKAGRMPATVEWLLQNKTSQRFCLESEEHYLAAVADFRTYPLAAHWRWLLCCDVQSDCLMQLRQIEDERMPSMAWIAVDDPRALTRGDFVRLCFADGYDPSETLPYAPKFLERFKQDYCYDRYWSDFSTGDQDAGAQKWMTTRFMNCGYAFTMLGEDYADDKGPGFFANPATGALSHFSNHYFMMGLIVHFQKVALLYFSDQLSAAVTKRREKELREKARITLRQLLDFTDRYWFVDLSNQMQAQELYQIWRRHLKLDELYAQVMDEAHKVTAYLEGCQRDRLQSTNTWMNWIIGTVGLVLGFSGLLIDSQKLTLTQVWHRGLQPTDDWVGIFGAFVPLLGILAIVASLLGIFRFIRWAQNR